MGLCFSTRKSGRNKFKDKRSRICDQIQSAVSPNYSTHERQLICKKETNGQYLHQINRTVISTSVQYNHSVRMATSLPTIMKQLVSKNRNRYKEDGFNLDLSYITDNIIAMGYPAQNIEGVYRNHIDEVYNFMEKRHKDHYYIYNLCSERSYDRAKFENRVKEFPFDDHNPPKLELIPPFCKDVHEWLKKHPQNVAAVHCKAGKGRTGTMICCYLLHNGKFKTADEALEHYGQMRTQDRKGVTIPSQVRYIKYYERILRDKLTYAPTGIYIKEFFLTPPPTFAGSASNCCVSFSICQQKPTELGGQKCVKVYKSRTFRKGCGEQRTFVAKLDDVCLLLTGDAKVEFYHKSKIGRKEKQLQFWFNTFFAWRDGATDDAQCGGGDDRTLVFSKRELDIVSKKDKHHKVFSENFQLKMVYATFPSRTPPPDLPDYGGGGVPWIQNDTHSESSATDSTGEESNEEDEWDSVMDRATLDPRGVGYRILSECDIASQLASSGSEQQPEMLTA